MIPAGHHVWRLSEGGDQNLGLSCTQEGLFLGCTALVERCDGAYVVRPQADLERLFARAHGAGATLERVMPGLASVATALGRKNLPLAQIAALHRRLPDLPDVITRAGLESEDRLIKSGHADSRLARAGWDEAEHPRAGTKPNPGWFAPKDSSGERLPVPVPQVAQGGRGRRESEEILDPAAPIRQAVWGARIGLLRRIDPDNSQLTYFANPNSPPTQAALNRLDAAIEAASIKRVTDKVMLGGAPIGKGNSRRVREVAGGVDAARGLFDELRVGRKFVVDGPDLRVVKLPGHAGFITFRPASTSPPAVDVSVPGVILKRIHFR